LIRLVLYFMSKICILDDTKICNNCADCEVCDLEPGKVCDNCAKCLDEKDYSSINIDRIIIDED
jgi:hypothetical protein